MVGVGPVRGHLQHVCCQRIKIDDICVVISTIIEMSLVVDSCLIFKHIDLNDVRGCEIVQAMLLLVKVLQSAIARLNAF